MRLCGARLLVVTVLASACAGDSPAVPFERAPGSVAVRLTTAIPDTIRGLSLYVDALVSGAHPQKSISWYLDGGAIGSLVQGGGTYTTHSDSTWTLYVTQSLTPGKHRLLLRATDSTRVVDTLVSDFFVKIDTLRYHVAVLPTLGGIGAEPHDINASGVVAGMAQDAAGAVHPVKWTNGEVQALPDNGLGGAYGLNNTGAAVGLAQDPRISRGCVRGVIWQDGGAPQLLPDYPSSAAPDTSAGCVAGGGDDFTKRIPSGVFCFPGCAGESSWPLLINDRGSILTRRVFNQAGEVRTLTSKTDYMDRWSLNNKDEVAFSAQTITYEYNAYSTILGKGSLPPLIPGVCGNASYVGRDYVYVGAIDDQSNVVGTSVACDTRAFQLNAAAQVTDLSDRTGALGAVSSNKGGDILFVGTYSANLGPSDVPDGSLAPHIVRGGKFAAITTDAAGWTKLRVKKMNDYGAIIGTATGPDGAIHAVLLTPPSP